MPFTILHTNDWHFSTKNPVSRTDDYNEELFASLDNLLTLVRHFKPVAVCVAGDLFHDKDRAPWRVLIRLLTWATAVRAERCEILTIPGNHDEKHDQFESSDRTPYGALVASGLFTDVSRRSVLIGGDEGTQGRPGAIWVYGIPWPDGADAGAYLTIPQDRATLVMAHGWATPQGEPRYGNWCAKYDTLAGANPHVKLWHFGHDHSDNGVFALGRRTQFVNIGALCRGALDSDTLVRTVKVAISTWDELGLADVQQVALPVPPASEIFNLTLREQRAKEQQALTAFVERFKADLGGGLMSVRYEDILARTPLDAAVRAKVEAYIAAAEGQS